MLVKCHVISIKYNVKILPLQLSEGRGRVFLVRGFKGEWGGGLFFRGGALAMGFSGGRFSHASFGKKMNMTAATVIDWMGKSWH